MAGNNAVLVVDPRPKNNILFAQIPCLFAVEYFADGDRWECGVPAQAIDVVDFICKN